MSSNERINLVAPCGIDCGTCELYLCKENQQLFEYLVGKGIAFRQAHGIVGALVADCEKQNKMLRELTLDQFKQHCAVIETDVYESLGSSNVANHYITEGAAGPRQAKRQIDYWTKQLEQR